MGISLFAGGTRFSEQGFAVGKDANFTFLIKPVISSIPEICRVYLVIFQTVVIAVLIPTTFNRAFVPNLSDTVIRSYLLQISRAVRDQSDLADARVKPYQ